METNCEIMFWKIVPAIRRELARILVEDMGMGKKAAAEAIGMTPAALSQYLKGKRGRFELPEWARKKIRNIAQTRKCYDVCEICMEIRRDPRFAEIIPNTGRCLSA